MITPKGRFTQLLPTIKLYRPYLLLGFISASAIGYASHTYGYLSTFNQMFFAFVNVLFAIAVLTVDLNLSMKQAKGRLASFKTYWLKPVAAVMGLVIATTVILFSTIVKDAITYAVTRPPQVPDKIAISSVNPAKLTDSQILDQLRDDSFGPTYNSPPRLGIYDPNRNIRTQNGYIRHFFIDWRDDRALSEQLLFTKRFYAVPLVTIEPQGQNDGEKLLTDIANGKYDARIAKLIDTMATYPGAVYVRFAHEMDLKKLYPWGAQDPELFISAYRHVIELADSRDAENIKWVWSPAGNNGADAYYPGDDVVDIIGVTMLYDRYWYSNSRVWFGDLSAMRKWIVHRYSKPVWVVEFGVGKADPYYQKALIQDAIARFQEEGYEALIYLNTTDANIKGPDYLVRDTGVFGKHLIPANTPSPRRQVVKEVKPDTPRTVTLTVDNREDLDLSLSFSTLNTKDHKPSHQAEAAKKQEVSTPTRRFQFNWNLLRSRPEIVRPQSGFNNTFSDITKL